MKNSLTPHSVGLAFGGALGLWHLTWSILIAVGLAQPLLDLVFDLHMLEPAFLVQTFSLQKAAGLVILTSVIGYVMGYILGYIWNMVQKGK